MPSTASQTDYVRMVYERSSDKNSIYDVLPVNSKASVQSHVERQQRAREARESRDSRADVKHEKTLAKSRMSSQDSSISRQLEIAGKLEQNADERLGNQNQNEGKSVDNSDENVKPLVNEDKTKSSNILL